MKVKVEESCGNVFIDLGFPPEEAAVLLMRTDLMAALQTFIETKGLTQVKAAELFGVTQSRISDLVRHKWKRFSLETLIVFAAKAGIRIRLEYAA